MATKTVIRRRPRVISSSIERVESVDSATPIADVLTQVAYVFFAILEGLLIARFVLRLAAANPFQDIVAWVYNATAVFVMPFESLFASTNNDASVLEVSTIVAMISYLFIFYVVIAIFRLFVEHEEVVNPEGRY